MTNNYTAQQFLEDCFKFNEVAEKHNLTSFDDFVNQQELIEEEVLEGFDALEGNDVLELLDGTVDVLVTALGQLQKLEQLGIDVYKAMQDTVQNNLSKFVSSEEEAIATSDMYFEQGIQTKVVYNPKFNLYCIKNSVTDKIMKPIGFQSNDLSSCLPAGLQEKGFSK